MATNPEKEIIAFKEGAVYFDVDYDSLKNKQMYKHENTLNTGLWYFRKYDKEILIFTDQIAGIEYLFTVIPKNSNITVYYYDINASLASEYIKSIYSGTNVKFKKILFKPSQNVPYKTHKGKSIPYSTIVLAGHDTVIFDRKGLGLKKSPDGCEQVYRVKDKYIFQDIRSKFDKLLYNK